MRSFLLLAFFLAERHNEFITCNRQGAHMSAKKKTEPVEDAKLDTVPVEDENTEFDGLPSKPTGKAVVARNDLYQAFLRYGCNDSEFNTFSYDVMKSVRAFRSWVDKLSDEQLYEYLTQ